MVKIKYKFLNIYDNKEDMSLWQRAKEKFLINNPDKRLTDRNVLIEVLTNYTRGE